MQSTDRRMFTYPWRTLVRPITSPPAEAFASIAPVLRPPAALALCRGHRGRQVRVHVRGRWTVVRPPYLNDYINIGILGALSVINSASHRDTQRSIPNGARVVAYGLLACAGPAPLLELYSWQTTQP